MYMLKISKVLSVFLSLAIAALFFIACIGGLFVMPGLTDTLIGVADHLADGKTMTPGGRTVVLAAAYGIVFTFIFVDMLLTAILLRVKKGQVFSDATVALIRGVSWCCFLLCLLFGILGIFFLLSFAVAFIAVFLGLCLRVVKNVIEEATQIKDENDLTV